MALLLQADVARGASSAEITVVPNTLVSINTNGAVEVLVENGTGGFVSAFVTDTGGPIRQAGRPFSFVATSDTIKVKAVHDDIHITVWGDEE